MEKRLFSLLVFVSLSLFSIKTTFGQRISTDYDSPLFGKITFNRDFSRPWLDETALKREEKILNVLVQQHVDRERKLKKFAFSLFEHGKLWLFGTAGGYEQCHFVGMRLIELYRKYLAGLELSEEEMNFLTLTFYLSPCFVADRNLITSLMHVHKPFFSFFTDENLIHAAKTQISLLVTHYIKQSINEIKNAYQSDDSVRNKIQAIIGNETLAKGIIQELDRISQKSDESFFLDENDSTHLIYRFPKFVGFVVFVLKMIAIKDFPIVLQVKMFCENGYHRFDLFSRNGIVRMFTEDDRTLVDKKGAVFVDMHLIPFFGYTHNGFKKYDRTARRCYHRLYNHRSNVHSFCEKCLICQRCSSGDGCAQYRDIFGRFNSIVEGDVVNLIMPCAAHWTFNFQHNYVERFLQSGEFPALQEFYEQKHAYAEVNPILIWFIAHCHADRIVRPERCTDIRPEVLMGIEEDQRYLSHSQEVPAQEVSEQSE